jgi:hypothetical protein
MEASMNPHTTLGMIHAQELLIISLIRSLPPDMRRKAAEEFQAQVELSELPHLNSAAERDALDAFKAHVRHLSILLASIS